MKTKLVHYSGPPHFAATPVAEQPYPAIVSSFGAGLIALDMPGYRLQMSPAVAAWLASNLAEIAAGHLAYIASQS